MPWNFFQHYTTNTNYVRKISFCIPKISKISKATSYGISSSKGKEYHIRKIFLSLYLQPTNVEISVVIMRCALSYF